MEEKELLQKQIIELYNQILLAKTDLYVLCRQYQEKWPGDIPEELEVILLEEPKKKRARHKKKIIETEI